MNEFINYFQSHGRLSEADDNQEFSEINDSAPVVPAYKSTWIHSNDFGSGTGSGAGSLFSTGSSKGWDYFETKPGCWITFVSGEE